MNNDNLIIPCVAAIPIVTVAETLFVTIGAAIRSHNVQDEALTILAGAPIASLSAFFVVCAANKEGREDNKKILSAFVSAIACVILGPPMLGEEILHLGTNWQQLVLDELIGLGVICVGGVAIMMLASIEELRDIAASILACIAFSIYNGVYCIIFSIYAGAIRMILSPVNDAASCVSSYANEARNAVTACYSSSCSQGFFPRKPTLPSNDTINYASSLVNGLYSNISSCSNKTRNAVSACYSSSCSQEFFPRKPTLPSKEPALSIYPIVPNKLPEISEEALTSQTEDEIIYMV